jgi:hypothetical protein
VQAIIVYVRESDFSLMPSKKLFPLYHGKNKLLIVLKRDDDDDIRFILYQRVELDFYSASSNHFLSHVGSHIL